LNTFSKIIIIILCIIILSYFLKYNKIISRGNLQKDGFCVIKNILTNDDILNVKNYLDSNRIKDTKKYIISNNRINNLIKNKLDSEKEKYNFQDYIMYIRQSKVHTCHRDNNGSFFSPNQKHESYTIIFYLTDMEKNLDVVPGSHVNRFQNSLYLTDPSVSIKCNKGDAILFNSNIVHAGSILDSEYNPRIQMKYTHNDDLECLKHYQNFNKILNKTNKVNKTFQRIQKHITCQIPLLSDLTQNEIKRTSRGSKESKISVFQKIYSKLFYGDKDFYDLPDVK